LLDQAIKVVHVDDVPVENMKSADGWAISEFRLPVSGADGSATTIFYAIFRAGSTHSRHVHTNCDEFVAYVEGTGVVGGGDGRAPVGSGHRRRVPQGSEHFFKNQGTDEAARVVGFYVGAGSVEGSGYEHRGSVGPEDVEPPFPGIDDGVLVTVDETPVADLSGIAPWSQAQVRVSVGSHTGTANALFDAVLSGDAAIGRHRMRDCEQLYFVAGGTGVVESGTTSTDVRAGHVVHVPKEVEFAVRSTGGAEPLWFLGVLTGAGSLAEAGCEAS
jgi:mannose-6-phosphate isomerase-like protein (cupin superfamily)